MKANAQTKRIAQLIESAKQRFGDFSEVKKQEIFLTVREANQWPKLPPLKRGSRGMSRKMSGALKTKLA
jgi:hypothetical protein